MVTEDLAGMMETIANGILTFVDYGITIVVILIVYNLFWKVIFFKEEGAIEKESPAKESWLKKWQSAKKKGERSEKWLIREFKEVEDLETAVNANNLENIKSSLNKVQRAERRFFAQMEQAIADTKSLLKLTKDEAEKRNLNKIINELAALGRELPFEISDMGSDLKRVEAGKTPQKPLNKYVKKIKEILQGATELIEELKELETKYTK